MSALTVVYLFALSAVCGANAQSNFTRLFNDCRLADPSFDGCIKDALNNARPFFKTGVREYNVSPFDPFYAEEVVQVRGGPGMNYKLKLRDVYESGWTISEVTGFKSDLNKNFIQYTQSFPVKSLKGNYEVLGNLFGNKIANSGSFDLTLYEYSQVTTITWKNPLATGRAPTRNPRLKVRIEVQKIGNLSLHITNLLGGRSAALEGMIDRVINTAWQPGFVFVRPLINDLVSTAFTDIFDRAFAHFPFRRIIH